MQTVLWWTAISWPDENGENPIGLRLSHPSRREDAPDRLPGRKFKHIDDFHDDGSRGKCHGSYRPPREDVGGVNPGQYRKRAFPTKSQCTDILCTWLKDHDLDEDQCQDSALLWLWAHARGLTEVDELQAYMEASGMSLPPEEALEAPFPVSVGNVKFQIYQSAKLGPADARVAHSLLYSRTHVTNDSFCRYTTYRDGETEDSLAVAVPFGDMIRSRRHRYAKALMDGDALPDYYSLTELGKIEELFIAEVLFVMLVYHESPPDDMGASVRSSPLRLAVCNLHKPTNMLAYPGTKVWDVKDLATPAHENYAVEIGCLREVLSFRALETERTHGTGQAATDPEDDEDLVPHKVDPRRNDLKAMRFVQIQKQSQNAGAGRHRGELHED
eukprot:scaffold336989_cov19-Prasinocladus_malaysianus.AAC.2